MYALALKSLTKRAGLSLVCVFACALAVASLGSSLGVGDALEKELERLARTRRGRATHALAFLRSPGREVQEVAQGLGDRAAAVFDARGRARVPEGPHVAVNVLGIDDAFVALQGLPFAAPQGREAQVSEALAEALGVAVDDTILVDLPRASELSASLLFGDRSGAQITVRLKVTRILKASDGGEFTLRPTPDRPRTVFLARDALRALASAPASPKDGAAPSIANRILLRARDANEVHSLVESLSSALTLSDYGLRISNTALGAVVHANQASISEPIEAAVRTSVPSSPEEALAYLATGIDAHGKSIPYSVVLGLSPAELQARSGSAGASIADGRRIWLSSWSARDLDARVGDAVVLGFDLWREAGRLEARTENFVVAGIVPDPFAALDRTLIPSYPGISDAASLGEWDPPFPIDLARIRPKDEDFWKQYGPSPKAYLDIATARELFGGSGSRLTTLLVKDGDAAEVAAAVRDQLRPGAPPFSEQDLAAATGGSSALDFGAYFAGFSALLILSALLVAAAFVRFIFETRSRELGVLRTCGWGAADVRRLCMAEATLLSAAGALLGLAFVPLLSRALQQILRPVWARGVSESPALWTPESLLISTLLGFVLSVIALRVGLTTTLRREPLDLLLNRQGKPVGRKRLKVRVLPATSAVLFFVAALSLRMGFLPEGPGFFLLGLFALTCGVGLMRAWILSDSGGAPPDPKSLGLRGLRFRPARVLFVAVLLSNATFVVFSVSSFAKRDTSDRTPGGPRGGYDLFVETSSPVFDDLGTPEGRMRAGLGEGDGRLRGAVISRFRLREGEDTSCLNLYAPKSPRILGVEAGFRALGNFSFAKSLAETEEEKANPWKLLVDQGAGVDEIPAIVDANSLQYVLHKSLGDTMEILDGHGRPLKLKFVAALNESALRSEILIAEESFERFFKEAEGYRVFLVRVPTGGEAEVARVFREGFRNRGALVTLLSDRLARYYEVENTYLASFQWLGALAAALSTLTLAAVAARSVFERRAEWFVLRTTGFSPRDLRVIVAAEITALSIGSISIGALAAMIALLPLPRASHPALVLTLLFPALSLLATAAATFGAFRIVDSAGASRPAIG